MTHRTLSSAAAAARCKSFVEALRDDDTQEDDLKFLEERQIIVISDGEDNQEGISYPEEASRVRC